MSNVSSLPDPDSNLSAASEDDALLRSVMVAIKALVGGLTPEDRARVYAELAGIVRPIAAPRAGEILGTIIRLLPRRKEWTIEELKQGIADDGVKADPKEVYNAVSYLARKKHIRRIGYGRYLVDGAYIVTADDLGGAPSRHEDGYRLDWEGKKEGE